MKQSSFNNKGRIHVACVMDGNGRWALARGLARTAGHRAGVEAVRRVVKAAPGLGISTLSLYAFSSDNWKRPALEVDALMALLGAFLRAEIAELKKQEVRLTVIGRRDRLPAAIRAGIARAEWETRRGRRLHLRLAVDYSARDALCRAAQQWASTTDDVSAVPDADTFARHLAVASRCPGAPPVDLLVRTGGEQRLSDFLLWECAYAELLFLPTPWPDVNAETLAQALSLFRSRERRFGGLAPTGT